MRTTVISKIWPCKCCRHRQTLSRVKQPRSLQVAELSGVDVVRPSSASTSVKEVAAMMAFVLPEYADPEGALAWLR